LNAFSIWRVSCSPENGSSPRQFRLYHWLLLAQSAFFARLVAACGILVEIARSGLDQPVLGVSCRHAAAYFPRFSAEELARGMVTVIGCGDVSRKLASVGTVRSRQFGWEARVGRIRESAQTVIRGERARQSRKRVPARLRTKPKRAPHGCSSHEPESLLPHL
jgi:hypothetical protein